MRIYYPDGMSFFGERAIKHLGFKSYQPNLDNDKPTLFFLYFAQDYNAFIGHKGKRYVFWNGSDVLRMLDSPLWVKMIKENPATHACHNLQLQMELKTVGVDAVIRPIFFGDINDYPVSYTPPKDLPHIYMTTHQGRHQEYGVNIVSGLHEFAHFHIYDGSTPEEVMDAQIKDMHSCLRLNHHDGLSQTLIKSILMGHYPITYRQMEGIWQVTDEVQLINCIKQLSGCKEPNYALREMYIGRLNKFDWL